MRSAYLGGSAVNPVRRLRQYILPIAIVIIPPANDPHSRLAMTRNNTEPDLFDRLRGSVEESQAAWRELRERLRAEPERYARPLATALLASLETGSELPVRGSILPAVEATTREHPAAVPPDVLDRLLVRAAEL